jgi:lipopolysaccharide export LptBFGC system permease protein LptF
MAAIFLESAFIYITLLIIVFVLLSSYLGFKLGRKKRVIKIICAILLIIVAKFGFVNLVTIEKNVKSRVVSEAPTMVFYSREGATFKA